MLALLLRLHPEPAIVNALVDGDAAHLLEDLIGVRPEHSLCPDIPDGVCLIGILHALLKVTVNRSRVS